VVCADYVSSRDQDALGAVTAHLDESSILPSKGAPSQKIALPLALLPLFTSMRAKITELTRENERLREERELEKAGGLDLTALDSLSPGTSETLKSEGDMVKAEDDGKPDLGAASVKQERLRPALVSSPSAHLLSTRLFARLYQLREENEELGEALSTGRVGQLEEEVAALRQIAERRKEGLEGGVVASACRGLNSSRPLFSPPLSCPPPRFTESRQLITELDDELETAQATLLRLRKIMGEYERLYGRLPEDAVDATVAPQPRSPSPKPSGSSRHDSSRSRHRRRRRSREPRPLDGHRSSRYSDSTAAHASPVANGTDPAAVARRQDRDRPRSHHASRTHSPDRAPSPAARDSRPYASSTLPPRSEQSPSRTRHNPPPPHTRGEDESKLSPRTEAVFSRNDSSRSTTTATATTHNGSRHVEGGRRTPPHLVSGTKRKATSPQSPPGNRLLPDPKAPAHTTGFSIRGRGRPGDTWRGGSRGNKKARD
jgi:hypothetical protein